ncbi:FAD-binding oxidoreductase [Candidatus Thorarchaeota archaeon]|nr:MAG: FAD-binding oxidoreductase [Candidatus Thorarchaeota archaeon]
MGKDMKSAMIDIVGNDNVSDDMDTLFSYSGYKVPSLIVWPIDTRDVALIVQWANKYGVPIVPRSSSGPDLRDASLPRVSDSIVVDLSRMNKILRIDSQNKVVMIQPGVTYGKLIDELKKNGLRPAMPFLPSISKSVLSSCLDREPITMPRFHWDSSDPLLCTETVFGTGDILRTGAAAGPGSLEEQWASGQAQKNPQGPSQFDPFRLVQGSQGTIGIVTWISMKCEMLPDIHSIYLAGADNLNQLLDFNYEILRRRLADEHFILNRINFTAALGADKNLPNWILILGVSGHGMIADEELAYRIGDIMDIAEDTDVRLCDKIGQITGHDIESKLNNLSHDVYWKLVVKGECREIFFTTTLDRCQEFYEAFLKVADEVDFSHDQIGAYIQPTVQGTNTHCGFDLYYSLADVDATEGVLSLIGKGQTALLDMGAYFSRPYGLVNDLVFKQAAPTTVDAMHRVKSIFDPNNILNPRVLCFKEVP